MQNIPRALGKSFVSLFPDDQTMSRYLRYYNGSSVTTSCKQRFSNEVQYYIQSEGCGYFMYNCIKLNEGMKFIFFSTIEGFSNNGNAKFFIFVLEGLLWKDHLNSTEGRINNYITRSWPSSIGIMCIIPFFLRVSEFLLKQLT